MKPMGFFKTSTMDYILSWCKSVQFYLLYAMSLYLAIWYNNVRLFHSNKAGRMKN